MRILFFLFILLQFSLNAQEPLIAPDWPGSNGTVTREEFSNIPTADTGFCFLQGTIKNQATGDSLAGGVVYIMNASIGAMTDMQGFYKLKLPAPGKYLVVVKYIGYQPFIAPVIVKKRR
jgi:hypothetical protein